MKLSGNAADAAALRTPGTAETRRITSSKNAICCSGFAYLTLGSETFMVSTFVGSKPGSTLSRRTKLLRSSPAPTIRSNESVTCPTTSAFFA